MREAVREALSSNHRGHQRPARCSEVLRGAQKRSRRHARILAQQGAALGRRAVQLAQVADHQIDRAWERSAQLGALAVLALARHVGRSARVEVGARAVVGAA